MPRRKSDPLDAMVGAKVRVFRINRGISQTALAEKLGVTFQQVQKYEKGANRIGASRLSQIATALDISIAELFEPSREKKAADIDSPFKLLAEPGALRVLKAYVQTSDPAVRRAIVNLIEGIASREPSSRSAVARQNRGKRRAHGARA
jgi:transcriptional regulator with XRE-family HTH domain